MPPANRRQFLQALPGLAAVPALAAPSEAMTFGFSLYGMKTLKTEPALRQLAAIGFDSVELCLSPGWDAEPDNLSPARRKSIRALLANTRLRLTALMENLKLNGAQKANHERLKKAAALGSALAPEGQPLVETIMGGGQWDAVKNEFRDHLGGWAEVAAQEKLLLAVKPHRFGAVNRPEQALWLLEQVQSPWVKLTYDYSHFAHRGMTLEGTLRSLLPHTRFIHVKDTVLRNGRARFVLPGASGQIDYVRLLKLAAAGGYRGDICCEVSGQVFGQKGYDPVQAAKACHANLAPAFKRAGIRRAAAP